MWDDPSLMADPSHQVFREWIKLVKPVPMPANARVVEMFDTMNAGLRELYLGKQAPRQAIASNMNFTLAPDRHRVQSSVKDVDFCIRNRAPN